MYSEISHSSVQYWVVVNSTPLPDPFSKVISLLYDPSNFQYPINPCSSDVFKLIVDRHEIRKNYDNKKYLDI